MPGLSDSDAMMHSLQPLYAGPVPKAWSFDWHLTKNPWEGLTSSFFMCLPRLGLASRRVVLQIRVLFKRVPYYFEGT